MAIDPVCCMTVDEQSAATTSAHAGTTFYFCSTDCGAKFEANPAAYSSQPEPVPAHKPGAHAGSGPLTQPPATTYTCPMHAEVRHGAGTPDRYHRVHPYRICLPDASGNRARLGDHKTVIGFALAALAMSPSLGASAQSSKQSGPADPSVPVPPTKYEFVFSGNSRLRSPAKSISFSDDGR